MEMDNLRVSVCEWVGVVGVASNSNSREATTISSKCSSNSNSSTTVNRVTMGKWVDIMVRDREGTPSTSGTTEQQTREKQTALKLNL